VTNEYRSDQNRVPGHRAILRRLSDRRTLLQGAGLGLSAGALGGLNRQAASQELQPATPAPATPGGEYVGSDSTTTGNTGAATPAPIGELPPFTPYDPVLKPAASYPKEILTTFRDQTVFVAKDVAYAAWTFDGTVPGPVHRAVVGDTINVTVRNEAALAHNLDFHSAQVNPERAYHVVQPGEEFQWSFQPKYPGAYMYHCGTAPVLMHIGAGMYSTMIVDPAEGWSPAQELVFIQSEFYLTPADGDVMVTDAEKLFSGGTPNYVVFNGYANQYVEYPITVKVGEPIRIFVINCGPNVWSSFHVVGAIFDRVYLNANPANESIGMQSVSIGPGDGACVEFTLDEPGTYVAVNHSFGHAANGAQALLRAE